MSKTVLTESQLLGTMAVTRGKARQKYFVASIHAVVTTIELRPSVTKSNDEREPKISDRMVGNKILHASPRTRSLHTSKKFRTLHTSHERKQRTNNMMAGKASRSTSYHEQRRSSRPPNPQLGGAQANFGGPS